MSKKAEAEELDEMEFGDMDFGEGADGDDAVDTDDMDDEDEEGDEESLVEGADGDAADEDDKDEDEDEAPELKPAPKKATKVSTMTQNEVVQMTSPFAKAIKDNKAPAKKASKKKELTKRSRKSSGKTALTFANAAAAKGRTLDLAAHALTGHLGIEVKKKATKLGLSSKAVAKALSFDVSNLTGIYRGFGRASVWCIDLDRWNKDHSIVVLEPGQEVYPTEPTIPASGSVLEGRMKEFLSTSSNAKLQELAAEFPLVSRGRPSAVLNAEVSTQERDDVEATQKPAKVVTKATRVKLVKTKAPAKVEVSHVVELLTMERDRLTAAIDVLHIGEISTVIALLITERDRFADAIEILQ